MDKWFLSDERGEQISGKLALLFLGLTQAGLLVAIVFQRYAHNLPTAYYNDLAIVLAYSVIGFWGFNLFLGGLLPVLSARSLASAYLLLVLSIGIPHILIRGVPVGISWVRWLLVTFGAPAVLVGGYGLVALLGKRRLDRLINS